jgi:hypothetical protein
VTAAIVDLTDWDKAGQPMQTITGMPQWSRVCCYWAGGKDWYRLDQDAARAAERHHPPIVAAVHQHAAFQARAVRHLAGAEGLRQFLIVGTDFPVEPQTSLHEVVQQVAPKGRVVYADPDPVVMAHAQALMVSDPPEACGYVRVDLNDPSALMAGAARTLDFGEPVAVLVLQRLQQIPSDVDAAAFMGVLIDAIAPGSHVVVTHLTDRLAEPKMAQVLGRFSAVSGQEMVTRSPAQIAALLAGLEPIDPGVVPVSQWRPEPGSSDRPDVDMCALIGRKA